MHYYSRSSAQGLLHPSSLHSTDIPLLTNSGQERTCCFTGHRMIDAELLPQLNHDLTQVLKRLWADGYRSFWCGGALGFDTLAARAVMCLRDAHPDVRLLLAIPCEGQSRSWTDAEKAEYDAIRREADEVVVLAPHYYQGCMIVRNRFMCDRSSFVVSYLSQMKGGTLATVAYAVQLSMPVLNLAVEGLADRFVAEGASALTIHHSPKA